MMSRKTLVWLLVLTLGPPLLLTLDYAIPTDLGRDWDFAAFIFFFVVGLIWITCGATLLVWSALLTARRSILPAIMALIFPIVTVINVLDDMPILVGASAVGDAVHFVIMKPFYDKQTANRSTRALWIRDWESDPTGGKAIVHDTAGDFDMHKMRRGSPWLKHQPEYELGELCEVHPLWDHYYIAGFGC